MRRAVIETFFDPTIEADMQAYLLAYSQKDNNGECSFQFLEMETMQLETDCGQV